MSLKQYNLELTDTMRDVESRTHALKSKKATGIFGDDSKKAIAAMDQAFANAVNAAPQPFKDELTKLQDAAAQAEKKFHSSAVSVEKNGVRVAASGKTEAFNKAKTEYTEARQKLHALFSGDSDVVKCEKVTETFTHMEGKLKDAFKLFNSPLGMAMTEGPWAAVKHNFEQMQVWNKDIRVAGGKDRTLAIAVRGAVMAAAIFGMGDAAIRSRNGDGENRNDALRMIEFIASGGVGVAAALATRAR